MPGEKFLMETRAVKPVLPIPDRQGVPGTERGALTTSEEELERIINDVGEQIFVALKDVAQAAQTELSGSTATSTNTLVNPTNSMVGLARAERNVGAINSAVRDDLRRLLREPFVARVE